MRNTTVVRSCHRACDAKQTAYRAWSRARSVDLWNQFVHAATYAQKAIAIHDEREMTTLFTKVKRDAASLMYCVKPIIPALGGPCR